MNFIMCGTYLNKAVKIVFYFQCLTVYSDTVAIDQGYSPFDSSAVDGSLSDFS